MPATSTSDPFARAACNGKRWFPWKGTPTDLPHLWDAAQRLCERCPCRRDCAERALATPAVTGMWAGVRCATEVHVSRTATDARLRAIVADG